MEECENCQDALNAMQVIDMHLKQIAGEIDFLRRFLQTRIPSEKQEI